MSIEIPLPLDQTSLLPSRFERIWPTTFLILALMVTMAWTVFLGYGLVELIEMAL